jgi:hypothetical protein
MRGKVFWTSRVSGPLVLTPLCLALVACGSSDEAPQTIDSRFPGETHVEVGFEPASQAASEPGRVLLVERVQQVRVHRQVFLDGEDQGAFDQTELERRPHDGPVEVSVSGRAGEISLGQHTPDADGRVPVPLAGAALRTLASGRDSAQVTVRCEDAKAQESVLDLADLLALADRHTRTQTDPELEPWVLVGEDPRWVFWTVVHYRALTDQLRRAAAARLVGLEGGPQDPAALALLTEGEGREVMADGLLVDWNPSQGALGGHPQGSVSLSLPEHVDLGDSLWLVAECTNTGTGPLNQLRATIRSRDAWLDGYHILFGRIPPGYTVTRRIVLPVPAAWPGGPERVRLEYAEQFGYRPDAIEGSTWVRGGGLPQLSLSWHFVDDGSGGTVGNGDGLLQPGEAADVRVVVDNRGARTALEPRLSLRLRPAPGVRLVPHPGEVVTVEPDAGGQAQVLSRTLPSVVPQASADEVRFTISVSNAATVDQLDLQIWVQEGSEVEAHAILPLTLAVRRETAPAGGVGEPLVTSELPPPDEIEPSNPDRPRGTPGKLAVQVLTSLQTKDGDAFMDAWVHADDARVLSDDPRALHQQVLASRNTAWVALHRGHPDVARASAVRFEGETSRGSLGVEVHGGRIVYEVDGQQRAIPLDYMVRVPDGRWRLVRALPE